MMAGSSSEGGGRWWRWLGGEATVAVAARSASESFTAYQEGRYRDAERLLRAELQRIKRQSPDAVELGELLGELADLYRVQARYAEAEPLYQRAIALAEAHYGADHPGLARLLNSLALLYRAQGDYDRAEPLCRRALAIAEHAHGAEHPGTMATLSNLLTVCLAQGHFREAAPLFQRAVMLKERLLGPRHPALASSLSNYAAFLRKTRSEAEAAPWEARVRRIRGWAAD